MITKMPGKLAAVIQMSSTSNKSMNLTAGKRLIELAKSRGAVMAFLPEGFDYIAESKQQSVDMSEALDGGTISAYRQIARENQIALSLGGFHCKSPIEGKTRNTHVVINEQGELAATYEKIHLFDVSLPEKGVMLKESDYVDAGCELVKPIETPIGQVGQAICYDLRFPELSARLRQAGAQILTFPSAFTVETGMAHWETLIRARAIETQCYVIAAAQVGRHNTKRSSYGHSMIVDPWGTVLASCPDGEGVAVAEINLERLSSIRTNMPILQHRNSDLFGSPGGQIVIGGVGDGRKWPFGQVEIPDSCIVMHSEKSFVSVNRKPVLPGHLLVIPKRHGIQRLSQLRPGEVCDLFMLAQEALKVTESFYNSTSATVSIQDGPEAGQTIRQVHVHVLPRKANDFPENDQVYRELATHDKGKNVQWRSYEEMESEAEKLRNHARLVLKL